MDDEWITVPEAVDLTGYGGQYIRRLLRTKKIQGKKFGQTWMVSKTSLMEYLKAAMSNDDLRYRPHFRGHVTGDNIDQ